MGLSLTELQDSINRGFRDLSTALEEEAEAVDRLLVARQQQADAVGQAESDYEDAKAQILATTPPAELGSNETSRKAKLSELLRPYSEVVEATRGTHIALVRAAEVAEKAAKRGSGACHRELQRVELLVRLAEIHARVAK